MMKYFPMSLAACLCVNLATVHAQDLSPHPGHAPAADNRVILALSPGERAMILEEMRLFLDGAQKMTGALAQQDMQAAAAAASGMGMKMVHEVPPELRAKLPLEFRQLGFSVHRDFDQIAMDADSLKDVSHTLNQLSATLQKCVSCHAVYQIRSPLNDDRH